MPSFSRRYKEKLGYLYEIGTWSEIPDNLRDFFFLDPLCDIYEMPLEFGLSRFYRVYDGYFQMDSFVKGIYKAPAFAVSDGQEKFYILQN